MAAYAAPLRDMRFVMEELVDFAALQRLPGYEDVSPDLAETVLEEAAKVCEEVLHPLNRSGDEEGCHLENGVVRTPKGFRDAYKLFAEAGWTSLNCAPEHGGQGMPKLVDSLVQEMICSANLSFGIYPGLSHGAYTAISGYAAQDLQDFYLPKLASGAWAGAMCLTEPHCGTDLGLLRTRAVPQTDGTYKITGTKIFISSGDHDLTENIVHLVLARTPDAPKGTKGISLFLVPKFLPDADGRPGPRNGVSCGSLEHKMGIKASATCVMNFDEASGRLVGEPGKGMRAMFAMMNEERVAVGVQGLGLGEASYQGAAAYARDRLQGRGLSGAKRPDLPADPLLVHPDVRRMLLTQRVLNEGGRALVAWVSWHLDVAARHPDPETRRAAEDFVALMTPIVKAFLTDNGFEATNLGVQVYGGHGYIRENGMEQYVRDARIAQIYEGANGVQALDLVGRKLPFNMGRYLRRFFHPLADFIDTRRENEALAEFVGPLAKVFARLQQATMLTARRGMANPDEAGAASVEYLGLFGLTAFAYLWARTAEIAMLKQGGDETGFYRAKLAAARFFMARVLPRSAGLFAALSAGADTLMKFEDADF
jgi:alkylation response protein AidB-like acyl-CoA dehydrogenase